MQAADMTDRVLKRLAQDSAAVNVYGAFYSAVEALSAINEGIRFFTLLTLGLEKTTTWFTPTAGPLYHLLPYIPDYLLPLRIFDSAGKKLRPATLAELDALDSGWEAATASKPTKYCAQGLDVLALYKAPPQTSPLFVTYARAPVALVADGDAPEYPEDLHSAFVDYGVNRLRFREGGQEFAKSMPYLGRFLNEAQRYGDYIRERNKGAGYDRLPFELTKADIGKLLKMATGGKQNG